MKSLAIGILLLASVFAQAIPKSVLHHNAPRKALRAKATAHSVTLTLTGTGNQGAGVVLTGTGYLRGNVTGGPYTPLPACTFTAAITLGCVDSTVVAGNTYFYVAVNYCSACTGATQSPDSNEVTAVVPANTSPAPPVLGTPTVASVNPPAIKIPWKASTLAGVTRQVLLRQTGGAGPWVAQQSLKPAVTSTVDNNVKIKKMYAYEVEAIKGTQVLISKASSPVTIP